MIAAVTVHFGTHRHTQQLLAALENNEFISMIIVVLHSGTEPVPGSRAVYLSGPNRGYAAGLNLAVRHLLENRPEIDAVLAMNPDIKLDSGDVGKMVETHRREKADATFPSIREGGLLIQGYEIGRFGTVRRVDTSAHLFPGTCFLFSLDAWKRTDGFSEEYFHYFEDLDFCERIHRLKGTIVHASGVVVNHVAKSGEPYPATSLPRYAVRNHLLFLRKFGKLNGPAFFNVCIRQLLYLFRWPGWWRGIPQWYAGIREFQGMNS